VAKTVKKSVYFNRNRLVNDRVGMDMNHKQVKKYFLSKPESLLSYPFGPDVEVYKVKDKMFATFGLLNKIPAINLKCDPNESVILRDLFKSIIPGYHMNKRLWNTVFLDQTVPKGEVERMIDNSYALVVKGLKKVERERLVLLYGEARLGLISL